MTDKEENKYGFEEYSREELLDLCNSLMDKFVEANNDRFAAWDRIHKIKVALEL